MTESAFNLERFSEIDTNDKRAEYRVAVIGRTPEALIEACAYAEAGFSVICADPSPAFRESLLNEKAPLPSNDIRRRMSKHASAGRLALSGDVKSAVNQSHIIILAMSFMLDKKNRPNSSEMEKCCRVIGSALRAGTLIIVASASRVGFVGVTLRGILENDSGLTVGKDFGLVYSPNTRTVTRQAAKGSEQERIVAADDKTSLAMGVKILNIIHNQRVRAVEKIRVAEAAVLFAASMEYVEAAVAQELGTFCESSEIDYVDIDKLIASSKCAGSFSRIASDDTRLESCLLLDDAESLGVKLRGVAQAMEIWTERPKHSIAVIRSALRSCGKPLRRSRITILGLAERLNEQSSPKRIGIELLELLRIREGRMTFYDPYVKVDGLSNIEHWRKGDLYEAIEGADCVVIVTGHDQFAELDLRKMRISMRKPAAIVDLARVLDPEKVEKEGIVYRGFGRGVLPK